MPPRDSPAIRNVAGEESHRDDMDDDAQHKQPRQRHVQWPPPRLLRRHCTPRAEQQGFLARAASTDDRTNLINDATQKAIERFDMTWLEIDMHDAQAHFDALAKAGIDMHQAGETLQVEGVKLFEQAFDQLLKLLE